MNKAALKNKACEHIDQRRDEMIAIARRMLKHPELGYREAKTAAMVKEELQKLKLPIRDGLALTGVEGTLAGKEAGPTVVVMGELDSVMEKTSPLADPVTGAAHLCGHHIQVASMLGAAMGLVGAGIAPFLSGKVKFLGCPAEEYLEIEYRLGLVAEGKISFLGGKQELIKLGYFDDVDAAMMVHAFADSPAPAFLMNASGNGFMAKFIRYEGKPSHAGAAPHRGVNALNAACIGIMAVHAQRETFQDDDSVRVHPIITKGGRRGQRGALGRPARDLCARQDPGCHPRRLGQSGPRVQGRRRRGRRGHEHHQRPRLPADFPGPEPHGDRRRERPGAFRRPGGPGGGLHGRVV